MSVPYANQLAELRQRVPVGMRHGLALLAQTAGNVAQAAARFEAEMVALLIGKTKVAEDVAAQQLRQANFDVARALRTIEETRYSLAERILRRYHNPREAISRLAFAVAESRQLPRNFWLDFGALRQLPPVLSCVLMLDEWLNYADYEGLDCAIYFHLDDVLALLRDQLPLPQLSAALQQLWQAELAEVPQRQRQLKIHGYYRPSPALTAATQAVAALEPLLVGALHAFVVQHIQQFP